MRFLLLWLISAPEPSNDRNTILSSVATALKAHRAAQISDLSQTVHSAFLFAGWSHTDSTCDVHRGQSNSFEAVCMLLSARLQILR